MTDDAYYTGNPSNRQDRAWERLPVPDLDAMNDPRGYIASDDLVAAVNVALTLGQPLLLTGEPGCGKTQLAASIAHELGFDAPLKFEVKSNTEARDLFYSFDTVGRFHAAQTAGALGERAAAEPAQPVNYIEYNALGRAILYACDPTALPPVLPGGFRHPGRRRSVVLIDEIDKAPRDVPNDILNEIEAMYFRIPELGNVVVQAQPRWRPVVVVTSNSEKALPDAFLRRCIYYHVSFPEEAQLAAIVESRLGRRYASGSLLLKDAIALFRFLREPRHNLRKRPGTAELLNWLTSLAASPPLPARLRQHPKLAAITRYTLLKNEEDQGRAESLIEGWQSA